jgi:uncharacterized protein (DUF2147 family)
MEEAMIQFTRLCGAAALLAASGPALGAGESSIYGLWARGDGLARVQIVPCGGVVCAINTWIRPGVTDEKVGDKLVMNVEPKAAGILSGTAFDPQRELNYRLKINLAGSRMTTQGCVLAGFICKNMGWTRLQPQ